MSKTTDINLWGIHAGKTSDADTLFLKKNCSAVGWPRLGRPDPRPHPAAQEGTR